MSTRHFLAWELSPSSQESFPGVQKRSSWCFWAVNHEHSCRNSALEQLRFSCHPRVKGITPSKKKLLEISIRKLFPPLWMLLINAAFTAPKSWENWASHPVLSHIIKKISVFPFFLLISYIRDVYMNSKRALMDGNKEQQKPPDWCKVTKLTFPKQEWETRNSFCLTSVETELLQSHYRTCSTFNLINKRSQKYTLFPISLLVQSKTRMYLNTSNSYSVMIFSKTLHQSQVAFQTKILQLPILQTPWSVTTAQPPLTRFIK